LDFVIRIFKYILNLIPSYSDVDEMLLDFETHYIRIFCIKNHIIVTNAIWRELRYKKANMRRRSWWSYEKAYEKHLITINKNDGDITPSSIAPLACEARISGESKKEREGRTERAIIPISTARVVDLSNQSVAAPGGRK